MSTKAEVSMPKLQNRKAAIHQVAVFHFSSRLITIAAGLTGRPTRESASTSDVPQAFCLHTLRDPLREWSLCFGAGMPLSHSVRPSEPSSVQLFLRQARRFQRAVESDSPSAALPILRRLIKVGAIGETSLTQLFHTRQQLQRKHFLRMLALESGFRSWETFRPILAQMSAADLAALQFLDTGAAQLKLWFADSQSAQSYAADQGGRVIAVGQQAVVITD